VGFCCKIAGQIKHELTMAGLTLVRSIGENCLKGVQEALRAGANPDTRVEGLKNVIHLACDAEVGNVAIVRELLNFRADPNDEQYHFRDTPLHRASLWGHAAIVQELIDRKADIGARNDDGETPLGVPSAGDA